VSKNTREPSVAAPSKNAAVGPLPPFGPVEMSVVDPPERW
jgi:hypothetical protein